MLYDIGFFIFSVIYLPILIFKGKLHRSFVQRFAIFDKMKERELASGKDRIWIQAVSVGEVALCKSLVPLLRDAFPGHDIAISTITKAGNDLAKKIFPKSVIIIYFPLDFSFIVKKAVTMIKPKLYIMIETEIWPNLLKELSNNSVPSVLVNGRISDRSIGKYRMVKPFLKKTLDKINMFCMQDNIDAERIIGLGADRDKVRVTGNMKFDVEAAAGAKEASAIRASLGIGSNEDLFVAGSTHSGEEEIVAEAYKELAVEFPDLRLLMAPRHIDRVGEIEKVLKEKGLESVRFSVIGSRLSDTAYRKPQTANQVFLLDTIGHLNDAYSIATIVFIGGSLVKYGGHNPIEPAVFEKPIMFGPHMFNFKYIAGTFLKSDAAIEVKGREELVDKCRELLKDKNMRVSLGCNAKRTVLENSGAAKRNIEAIKEIL